VASFIIREQEVGVRSYLSGNRRLECAVYYQGTGGWNAQFLIREQEVGMRSFLMRSTDFVS
jgi:hypothetical protein